MIKLKGITWGHSRGYVPMVATAQRFSEIHPEVSITWDIRSLQAFADKPLGDMVKNYDLLVIDHPHSGVAAEEGLLLPLDEYLSVNFLQDQKGNQVGKSFDSYEINNHVWALPTDTATPVASWRPDKLANPPTNWEQLLKLAEEGLVAVPAIPIDSLMNFYSLCINKNNSLFNSKNMLVEIETGLWSLEQLKSLIDKCDAKFLSMNPIKVYETLCNDEHSEIYCPFAYGYTNYSRAGYADNELQFGSVPKGPAGKILRTTLGGAGLAISKFTQHTEWATRYAEYAASAPIQKTVYVENGGQPGHRKAWEDSYANSLCKDFFKETLFDLDNSYLRPRYPGYMHFQDNACLVLHDYLLGKLEAENALEQMNAIYLKSLK